MVTNPLWYPRRRENSKFSVFSFEFKRRGKGGGGAKFKIVGAPTFLLRVWRPGQHRMVDRNTSISILIYPRKTPRSPSGGLEHRSGIRAHCSSARQDRSCRQAPQRLWRGQRV